MDDIMYDCGGGYHRSIELYVAMYPTAVSTRFASAPGGGILGSHHQRLRKSEQKGVVARAKNVWALDFDGVVCDSCGESSLSAWKVLCICVCSPLWNWC